MDPIPTTNATTSGDLTWALATASTTAVADSGSYYQFTFDSLYTNDSGSFELSGLSAGRAPWLQLNTSGYYIYKATIHKESVFDNTNHTFIEPTYWDGFDIQEIRSGQGLPDFLGIGESNQASNIRAGAEVDESLYDELTFNYNPDDPISDLDSMNPLLVGLNLGLAGGASSISMSCNVWVMRIAAPGYVDLSP